MTLIAFRMDDICPGMDRGKFERFEKLFSEFEILPLLGIVPNNRDPNLEIEEPLSDFWDRMRDLARRGWSISQHGYEHRYLTGNGGVLGINKASEFASLPYADQLQKLRDGQNLMKQQGLDTDIFMAPAHSYDLQTLRALKETGFTTITDGYAPFIYRWQSLKFIPCQLGRPHKLPVGVQTICIHANTTSDDMFGAFERFIRAERRNIVDFRDLINKKAVKFFGRSCEQAALFARRLLRGSER